MKFWSQSLSVRLVISFVFLTIASVSLVGALAFIQTQRASSRSVTAQLTRIVSLKETQITRWIDDQKKDVVFLAQLPELRRLTTALTTLSPDSKEAFKVHSDLVALLRTAVRSQSDDPQNPSTLLDPTQLDIVELLVLDYEDALVLAATDVAREDDYFNLDEFFLQGRKGTFISPIHMSSMTSDHAFAISTPIHDPESGKAVGVLAAHLNLSQLDRITADQGLSAPQGDLTTGDQGEVRANIYLVDKEHMLVSGSQNHPPEYMRGITSPGIEAVLPNNDTGKAPINGTELYVDYLGVPVIGVYRWIPSLELGLLAEIPQEIAFQTTRQLVRSTMIAGVALSLILTVVAIAMARQIVRPIQSIAEMANYVSSGDFTRTAPIYTQDEIGSLARAFNEMTSRLRLLFESTSQSEAHFRLLIENASDIIMTLDSDDKIWYASPSLERVLGYNPESLMKVDLFEFIHPNDHLAVQSAFATHHTPGTPTPALEFRIRHHNGPWRTLEANSYHFLDDSLEMRLINARDITERRRSQEALRISEERYALAAQGANDGLWDWHLRENSVYYSPRWKAMLGYGPHEILDSPSEWFNRVHEDDRSQLWAAVVAHLEGNLPHFEHEHRMRHKDGSYRWMLARGMAVRDSDGTAARMAGSLTDITARKAAEEQLRRNAFYDSLTSLPNRALFMDRLGQLVERAKLDKDYHFAVLFLDFDRFKNVNDSLGHHAGDQLLISIAKRLEGCLRPCDTAARLGGDEFVLLLDNADPEGALATRVAENIQKAMKEYFTLDGHEVFITTSIGIALSSGYQRAEDLLRDADTAMYRAKNLGRDCYVTFNPHMHARAMRRLNMEADMRRALENQEEFVLYYQPIVSLQTGKITGAEALVRWQRPGKGLFSPGDFIPLAEETGLIIPLGKLVLDAACAQTRAWQEAGLPPLRVAVNLSARQFHRKELSATVSQALTTHRIDPKLLKIELTESVVMENVAAAIQVLHDLKALGVQLAIDDFGTGYSSLSYLMRFPIDILKIDRSFVGGISLNQGSASITSAIVTLAHNLNLTVISEGVETVEQLSFLQERGCDEIQGYLFSPPVPAEALTTMLREGRTLYSHVLASTSNGKHN